MPKGHEKRDRSSSSIPFSFLNREATRPKKRSASVDPFVEVSQKAASRCGAFPVSKRSPPGVRHHQAAAVAATTCHIAAATNRHHSAATATAPLRTSATAAA